LFFFNTLFSLLDDSVLRGSSFFDRMPAHVRFGTRARLSFARPGGLNSF